MEGGVADVEAQEPFEEQVALEPLTELALGTNGVERHQWRPLEQALRRDRGTSLRAVHRCQLRRELCEDCVHDGTDTLNGVVDGDQVLRRHAQQHRYLTLVRSAHLAPPLSEPMIPNLSDSADPFIRTLLGAFRFSR